MMAADTRFGKAAHEKPAPDNSYCRTIYIHVDFDKMTWIALITTLPTQNATARMRIWRTLKGLGCAVPRDGVYVLPANPTARGALETQAAEVREADGSAYVVEMDGLDNEENAHFVALFDRSAEYADIIERARGLQHSFASLNLPALRRAVKSLRRDFDALSAIDFFPGPARERAASAVDEAIAAANKLLAPDEPQAVDVEITRVDPAQFQKRVWATRKNIWIDRMASAWLIRRFIDPDARFIWLETPGDCPPNALGFDFDGARFTHVGTRVTFEVLLLSFGLDDAALQKIAASIHYLDVGGIPTDDARGLEAIIRGAKTRYSEDDALFARVADIFDDIYAGYSNDT